MITIVKYKGRNSSSSRIRWTSSLDIDRRQGENWGEKRRRDSACVLTIINERTVVTRYTRGSWKATDQKFSMWWRRSNVKVDKYILNVDTFSVNLSRSAMDKALIMWRYLPCYYEESEREKSKLPCKYGLFFVSPSNVYEQYAYFSELVKWTHSCAIAKVEKWRLAWPFVRSRTDSMIHSLIVPKKTNAKTCEFLLSLSLPLSRRRHYAESIVSIIIITLVLDVPHNESCRALDRKRKLIHRCGLAAPWTNLDWQKWWRSWLKSSNRSNEQRLTTCKKIIYLRKYMFEKTFKRATMLSELIHKSRRRRREENLDVKNSHIRQSQPKDCYPTHRRRMKS